MKCREFGERVAKKIEEWKSSRTGPFGDAYSCPPLCCGVQFRLEGDSFGWARLTLRGKDINFLATSTVLTPMDLRAQHSNSS